MHEEFLLKFFEEGIVSFGGLQAAICHDFESPVAKIEIQILGLLGELLLGPWMKRFYTSKEMQISHVDGIGVVKDIIARIQTSVISPLKTLTAMANFFGDELTQDDELVKLQRDPDDVPLFVFMMKCCLTSIVGVLEKQYRPNFELNITAELKKETESASRHNIDAEQIMGMFGALKGHAPNATLCYISSRMSAPKNNVVDYLDSLASEKRKKLVNLAINVPLDVQKSVVLERPVYNWKDVTEEFISAASQLKLGELLHDQSFGLFEAMSAIEMMDPKMDAGMMCNQIKRKVLSLEQATESGAVKSKDLSYRELIGVIDATLACLVTWLEGHSLAQTIFTNLYLHNPLVLEDRCLKAFSICMLKTVDHIREKVNRASVFEEEDFQPMTYGFKLAADVSDMRCTGMMKEVEDDLNRTMKNTRSKAGAERDSATEQEHDEAVALHSRVKFYRLFLTMLLSFGKDRCEGIPQAQKLLSQLSELLPNIRSTVDIGIKPDQTENNKNDYPTIMGFEPLVNHRLLPPTFPRYTVIRSRPDSINYLDSLLKRLQVATTLPEINSLHIIFDIFKEFSKSSPCVLSRSILQLVLLPPSRRIYGTHTIVDFFKDSIRNFIAPPGLCQKSPLYNNPQAKEYIDALLTHAVRPLCNLLQITGHNRARQRDKWAHILDDLSSLQEEADKVDAFLHNILIKSEPGRQHLACFGSWVLYYTLQAMISYAISGFELELYATYEYHYVYWYLYELLYAWLISALQRADNFLQEHENYMELQQKGRSNKKNKKKKRLRTLGKEITLAQAQQQMFGGYYKAVRGFEMDGKMKHPHFEFDSEEVRYSHRFAPFANVVTPPMIHFAQYKEMSDLRRYEPEPSAQSLYGASCKCFHQAKAFLESVPNPSEEIQSLIKVSKTNFVVMKLLMGGHKQGSKDPTEFDFTVHGIYPIIKL
ncbi:hypothetical protein ScPMuIL_017512 [Solemya velum]